MSLVTVSRVDTVTGLVLEWCQQQQQTDTLGDVMFDAKYIVTSHRAGYMPDEGPDWFADTARECWEAIRDDHEIMQDGIDPDFMEPDELNARQVAWATAHDAIEALIESDESGAVWYDDGRALPWVYEVSLVENLTPEEIRDSEPR